MTPITDIETGINPLASDFEKTIEEAWHTHYRDVVLWIETKLRYQTDYAFDAEDVAVDTFVTVFRILVKNSERGINRQTISGLIWTVVSRRYVDYLRRMTQQRKSIPTEPLHRDVPSEHPPVPSSVQLLLDSVHSDKLRKVLQLKYEGNTVPEIAEEMDVSPRTAKRLLRTLRDQLVASESRSVGQSKLMEGSHAGQRLVRNSVRRT